MLDAFGNNDKLAFVKPNIAIPFGRSPQFDEQLAFHHEKQLVFIFVMMPDKLAFELDELDVGVVQLADDFGASIIREDAELLGDVDFFHTSASHADILAAFPCHIPAARRISQSAAAREFSSFPNER